MAYTKLNWKNAPDTSTPLSAANLNHMETQYQEAMTEAGTRFPSNSAFNNLTGRVTALEQGGGSGGSGGAPLVDELRFPMYISHRGGRNVYPEHSWEGYRASYAAGFTPEADVRALADGTLVCIHDATTNRTMNVSKTVSAMTQAEWRAARVKPPTNGANLLGTGYGTPVFFEDYLNEFGGKTVLIPEIKDDSVSTSVIQAVINRGLQRSVVLQSFSLEVCQEAIQAGCQALLLGATQTPDDLKAQGIWGVGLNTNTTTNAYITSCKAAGLYVSTYTLNTKAAADADFARGVDAVFSDDPWGTSSEGLPLSSIKLDQGYLPPASSTKQNAGITTGTVTSTNGTLHFSPAVADSNQPIALKLGAFGTGGPSAKVRFWCQGLTPRTTGSQANTWLFGLYLGVNPAGDPIVESYGESKFRLAMVRRNGSFLAYERAVAEGGSTVNRGSVTTNPILAPENGWGVPQLFEVEFTPNSIRISNLSTVSTTSTTLTATHGTWTDQDLYLSLTAGGADTAFWDITCTR